MPEHKSWMVLMAPVIAKYRLAARMNMGVWEDTDGCEAMARLMEQMARIIDEEIDSRGQ